jgi:hypothetical protein
LVDEARSHLLHAVSALRQYVACTGDLYTERTILANLEILAGGDHQWLSRDASLDDLIRHLELDDEERDEFDAE